MRSSRAVISAFLAVLLTAPGAAAQTGDDGRAKARVIGEEGLALFDQGMYIDALDRFERADALIKAPTLGLMAARSLERLGRFVEASERYLQVARMDLDPKASEVWRQAVLSANKEREALLPKIPSIEITIAGPGAGGANVRIDGRAVPKAVIGVKTPIDPGVHRIEARAAGNMVASERITLNEGQTERLVLTLKPAEKGAVPDSSSPSVGETPAAGITAGTGVARPGASGTAGTTGPSADSPSAMGLGGSGKAEGLDDQTRATARVIGEEGLTLYDQGKYVDALDRFERADDLIKAPTLGLMAARSLDKLGRLVEASDRYQQVVTMKVDTGASDAFKQAQAAAAKEREALAPRIPSVDVSVAGPGAQEVSSLMLDGRRVDPALTGSARPISAKVPVDPGDHRLEAKSSSGEAFERFSVSEGGSERVVLTLSPSANKLLVPPGKQAKAPPADVGSKEPPERKGKTQEVLGWVSIGIGAAGVAVGAITGGVAADKHADFTDPPCDNDAHTCPSRLADDIDTYNTLRPVSSAGFIIGGIGLATGVILLVTLPRGGARYSSPSSSSSTTTSSVTVSPFIGPGSLGLRGTF
jgi:tetratricopeptide (TPR) repeat protein